MLTKFLNKLPGNFKFPKRANSSFPQPFTTPSLPPTKLLINNEWVNSDSGKTFPVVNPTNEQVVADLALGGKEDINAAVATARNAFKLGSTWRTMDASKRGILLYRLADLMERDTVLLASLEALECGKVYTANLKGDIPWAIKSFRYYAGYADKNSGETAAVDGNMMAFTRHEPVGVTAHIIAWNFSTLILSWKLAPALAAGCTAVVKPSQHNSLTTLHFGQLVKEAGFPPGVVNIVTGPGNVGSYLADHPDVDAITFTGSTPVGKQIYRQGAQNMKRLVLELGGKSPNIILKDADVDKAVEHAHYASFHNMGQCCCAGSRTYVHESIYSEFLDKMKQRIARKKIGDPFDLDVDHGPQATKEQVETVMRYIEQGEKEGATLEMGGKRISRPGYFIEPTLFTNVSDNMTIVKEEVPTQDDCDRLDPKLEVNFICRPSQFTAWLEGKVAVKKRNEVGALECYWIFLCRWNSLIQPQLLKEIMQILLRHVEHDNIKLIFGPVMQVSPFTTIDEVIEKANNTEYGLASSVFGNNIDEINTLVQAIRAGSVWVNCYFLITPQAPFGGYKMSGLGREGGRYGIEEFYEKKSVYIKTPTKNS